MKKRFILRKENISIIKREEVYKFIEKQLRKGYICYNSKTLELANRKNLILELT